MSGPKPDDTIVGEFFFELMRKRLQWNSMILCLRKLFFFLYPSLFSNLLLIILKIFRKFCQHIPYKYTYLKLGINPYSTYKSENMIPLSASSITCTTLSNFNANIQLMATIKFSNIVQLKIRPVQFESSSFMPACDFHILTDFSIK